jgi:hypothetical protein
MKAPLNRLCDYYLRCTYLGVCYACGLLICTDPVFAYIDPGTGSMLIQVLAAAIFGALFTMKTWLGSFKALFVRKKPGKESLITDKDEESK